LATSAGSLTVILTIHPSPYGSEFTNSGWFANAAFISVTVPVTGRNKSLTVFTASTVPKTAPASSGLPMVSIYTISPSSPCAKSVMPIVAILPSRLIHSWSLVYRRFPGKFITDDFMLQRLRKLVEIISTLSKQVQG
jgi:hypothetical protein